MAEFPDPLPGLAFPPALSSKHSKHNRRHMHQSPKDQSAYELAEWTSFARFFHDKVLGDAVTHFPDPLLLVEMPAWRQSTQTLAPKKHFLSWDALVANRNKQNQLKDYKTMEATMDYITDGKPHVFYSADTNPKPLLIFLPEGLKQVFQQKKHDLVAIGQSAIDTLIREAPPDEGTKDSKRYPDRAGIKPVKKSLRDPNSPWVGAYYLGIWKAQGFPHDPPYVTKDSLSTATRYAAVDKFFKSFTPVIQAYGQVLQRLDPTFYDKSRDNYEYWALHSPLSAFSHTKRACHVSLGLVINAQVRPHRDEGDTPDGWTAMTVFGNFTGGDLCLSDFNTRIPYKTGALVLFRSALLEHWITDFQGDRYATVWYTKNDMWGSDVAGDDDFEFGMAGDDDGLGLVGVEGSRE